MEANRKKNILYYIIILFLALLFFPKTYTDTYLAIKNIVFYAKIVLCCPLALACIFQKERKGFSKFFICQTIFIVLTLLSTILNQQDLIYYLKVYFLNFGALMLGEIVFRNKHRDAIIKFLAKYLKLLLIINLATVILKNVIGINLYDSATTFFIGMDNRFILYIIPCLLCYAYLEYLYNDKKYRKELITVYVLGIISLYATWSVASLLIMLAIGILYALLVNKKELIKRINMKYLFSLILAANYLIVIVKIQNLFTNFIVDALHKSITLSYRTILWDSGVNLVTDNFAHAVLGLGYFSPANLIPIYVDGTGVNHLHNLLIDATFSTGILGCAIYVISLFLISSDINRIKDKHLRITTILLFLAILLYLIFESFELYPIYYFGLFLFCYSGYIGMNKEQR